MEIIMFVCTVINASMNLYRVFKALKKFRDSKKNC